MNVKDELDAAMNIVKSHAEIREILKEYESDKASKLFGNGSVSVATGASAVDYDGVGKDGTAMLMNIEMNTEASIPQKKGKDSIGGKPSAGKKKKGPGSMGATKKK